MGSALGSLNRRNLWHIALNIGSMVIPMAVGLAVVPGLISRLGQDRFGALALAWALVGYFGWLDLGIGRALTQYLSQQEASGIARSIQAATARAARRVIGMTGLVWVAVLLSCGPLITGAVSMSPDLRHEAPVAWALLVTAVPLMMWSTCSVGALEARSRFVAISSIRLPTGVLTFCVPWLIALHTDDLRVVMSGLLAVRLVTALGYAWLASAEFATEAVAPPGHMRSLLRFGGWLTVTNLIGPLLSYFDRFAIAAILSMAAVTHYTVPFDALSRLPAAPIAMMSVFFPLLAHAHGLHKNAVYSLRGHLAAATRLMVALWLPALALMVMLGPWLLYWWVGAELARLSLPVWNWLAVGVVANGFAHIAFTLLQSAGRTDLIAKIHLGELVPYCLALWWALTHWGVVGAAAVWTLRVLLDTLILFTWAARLFPSGSAVMLNASLWAIGGSMVLALLGYLGPQRSLNPVTEALPWDAVLAGATLVLVWCIYHLSRFRNQP